MLIWAAFLTAGFLCAPLLRWPGFVITTFLVIVLYWVIVGLPSPWVLSYAISFMLITIAMQSGYIVGLLATAKLIQTRDNVAVFRKRHTIARLAKPSEESGPVARRIEQGPVQRGE
ncbi:hypothetical protein [Labrys monachus]|uniref:Uncharacterized protein n=1 Tax=Labrys monachus TaxID=217067 RepID=A0ABU0FA11_9HYPH|nr:hypothetical protein [Labrys monachus]MDQ0391451.1 hypothetical protein [Labrys monachus]